MRTSGEAFIFLVAKFYLIKFLELCLQLMKFYSYIWSCAHIWNPLAGLLYLIFIFSSYSICIYLKLCPSNQYHMKTFSSLQQYHLQSQQQLSTSFPSLSCLWSLLTINCKWLENCGWFPQCQHHSTGQFDFHTLVIICGEPCFKMLCNQGA